MARQRSSDRGHSDRQPATTPEAREQQLASIAYDLAEEQMLAGTASSQVITHFLKVGSTRELIEQERMRGEMRLTEAKIENMKQQERMDELFSAAIDAMKSYSGHGASDHEFEPGQD